MANHLHITQRTYSRYENGERGIPTEILCQLAEFHNTSTDYLLNRTNVKETYPKK
ncbi:MAG: helix-turn-helix domain-containing protein [Lachnospiraceae bacterium]|nr:helix-turn-helix domain-containing protein [Lachnospiraceae bacterium]